jgi:hypothetical protein
MELIPREMFTAIGIFFVSFIATLIIIPIIVLRLPTDYFDENQPRVWLRGRHPAIRAAAYIIKNAVGVVVLIVGIAMLVLPGQGLLTILIGLSLVDFPGKRKLEHKLIARPTILAVVNALRRKFGRPPLVVKPCGGR